MWAELYGVEDQEEGPLDGLRIFYDQFVLLGFEDQETCNRCGTSYYPDEQGTSYIADNLCLPCLQLLQSRLHHLRKRNPNHCPINTKNFIYSKTLHVHRSRRVRNYHRTKPVSFEHEAYRRGFLVSEYFWCGKIPVDDLNLLKAWLSTL